jgi:DNA-binding SARP family transcriptional activator/TolB-like protein
MSSNIPPDSVNPLNLPPLVSSARLRLRLIGQMEAWSLNSESVLPTGRKTRALLGAVALSGSRPALRGRLAELLWSRSPEEQARASLRQEIHRLLDILSPAGEDLIVVTRDHLTLRPGAVWVDVEEVMRATLDKPVSLSLLDGDLMEDLDGIDPPFDNWLTAERERLRDHGRTLAEALLREHDDPEKAIPAAQRLLAIDRAHEGAWRTLMRVHAARGERGLAIQAYDRCRAVLADQLDTTPSAETQELLAEIRGSGAHPHPRPRPRNASLAAGGTLPDDTEPISRSLFPPGPSEPRGLRGGSRIGVTQFGLVGTVADDAHLAPGLASEITFALSRFRWMAVVMLGDIDRLVPEKRSGQALRDEFSVDFLLTGDVRRVGQRLRVNVRLIDLRNHNRIVWAQRFDDDDRDLLKLQEEIASAMVGQLDPEILLIESTQIANQPLVGASAYDLVLRAIPLFWRMEHDGYLRAGDYLSKAIELEPEFAVAHSWMAIWCNFLVGQGWADDPLAAIKRGAYHAERTVNLDPQDARGLTIAGHIRAFLTRRPHEALALHERALQLNPNLPMAWAFSAFNHAYLGLLDEAEYRANRYKLLSPLDPYAGVLDFSFVQINLLKRDFEAAARIGHQVLQINPTFTNLLKLCIAALGYLDHDDEAALLRKRLLEIEPNLTIRSYLETTPFTREQDQNLIAVGLRRGGIAEGD